MKLRALLILMAALTVALPACGEGTGEGANNGQGANNGKGDTPDDDEDYDPVQACQDRRADVLEGGRSIFTEDAIRWSCADVAGVDTNNVDSRGQEYCEYFAVVPEIPETYDGELGEPGEYGRNTGAEEGEQTPLSLELNEDQIFYLEDHIDETLGHCVFTSWHNDVPGPVPACEEAETCPTVSGLPIDEESFRMKLYFNGNGAANALVRDCVEAVHSDSDSYVVGESDDPEDIHHDDFLRGCMLVSNFGFEWRKSDSSVCASSMRLAECGCTGGDAQSFADTLVPPVPQEGDVPLRGFPLGGWESRDDLPSGCKHVEIGDSSQTVVKCGLTGADILEGQTDLKGLCRSRFGDNVVVYVPVPAESVECTPGDGPYTDTCDGQPWVIED